MRQLILMAMGVLFLLCLPVPASACWDGYSVVSDTIQFTGPDDEWDAGRARRLGTWARRLEALLGTDGHLEVAFGYGEACSGGRCESVSIRSEDPRALFDAVATALAIPAARRSAALGVTTQPFAVQVAASRDRAAADALAAHLSELDLPMGFYEAGGFPADNPEAHVLEGLDAHGTVYRVVVGSFLDRADAGARAAEIARATGLPTILRAL